MSVHIIKVPDLGEGIAEVELVAWHVAPGEEVAEDQALADVMTDKANVEIPSPVAGRVVSLGGEPGQVLAVGADLIRIELGEGSGDAPDALQTPDVPNTPHAAEAPGAEEDRPGQEGTGRQPAAQQGFPAVQDSPGRAGTGPALASPAVRRHARELGIDLHAVTGTGPGGRVLHQDLDALSAAGARMGAGLPDEVSPGRMPQAAAMPGSTPAEAAGPRQARPGAAPPDAARPDAGTAGVQAIPLTGLRRRIAQRMQDSLRIPHFTYVEEVDVTEAERLRVEINERFASERGHLTLLALIVRAVAMAVRGFPGMNARFDDEAGVITQFAAVHMGIATHTPAGLVVPVVRDVQAKSVWSAAAEIAAVAAAARGGKATREQLSGSTITVTSLGALGGIVSTPVINLPEVAIIGVNRIVDRPVFRDGVVVPRKMMNLSSSFDHRVIDGMPAAQFVQEIRRLLECPALLFIE